MRRFEFRIPNSENSDSGVLEGRKRFLAQGRILLILILFVLGCGTPGIAAGVSGPLQEHGWPKGYEASFGFEIMLDHNGAVIVASVDSTTQAYRSGLRPGMSVIGWNTLPITRQLESMKVRKYRKIFPVMTDQNIKLMLLPRGAPGTSAEVFLMTETGNNRGIRVTAKEN